MSEAMNLTRFEKMLPFYVNGTLDPADCAELEAALAGSAELRARLEDEQRLARDVVTTTNDMLDEAEGRAEERLQTLASRLPDQGEAQTSAGSSDGQSGLAGALAFLKPSNWHPAVSLALAGAVAMQAALIGTQANSIGALKDENYRLASGNCECEVDATILAEFADDANWSQVVQLLADTGLAIDGAGDFGLLRLRPLNPDMDNVEALEALRSSPLVTSAEPAA